MGVAYSVPRAFVSACWRPLDGGLGAYSAAPMFWVSVSRFNKDRLAGAARPPTSAGSTGISSATFYTWKAKFGGLEVSDAKRLKQLEGENAKLKRLPADAMLDATALLSKKW